MTTRTQYGVQNKYDANDTQWFDHQEDAENALAEVNTFILVECEVDKEDGE